MRFTHIDVDFDVTHDGDQKPLKCAWKVFLNNFGDLHIWRQYATRGPIRHLKMAKRVRKSPMLAILGALEAL